MVKEDRFNIIKNKLMKQCEMQIPENIRDNICSEIIKGYEKLLALNIDLGEDTLSCIHISGRIVDSKLKIRYLHTQSLLEKYLDKNELKYEVNVNCNIDVWFDVNGLKLSRKDLVYEGQKQRSKKTE